jgi:hypothetical protein
MLDIDVKALVDELATKYPPSILEAAITNGLKAALVGRTITVEFKDGAMKVTVG